MAKQTHYPLQSDEKHMEQIRDAMRESKKALDLPLPDTFLGRRTHEPFPSEQDDASPDGQPRKPR